VNQYTPSAHAVERPESPAVIVPGLGQFLTYGHLESRSNQVAQLLRQRGVEIGDHVAIVMENRAEFIEVAWGCQRAGVHYTAVNSHLRATEVDYVVRDCGAKALFTTASMSEVMAPLDLDQLALRVSVGTLAGFETYADSVQAQPTERISDEAEGREMLYSSGTTGRPKGVRKTLTPTPLGDPTSIPVQIALGMVRNGVGPDTVYLSPAPLYHAAPLVYAMSMTRLGATVVVMDRFDPEQCLDLIDRYQVTHAQFVPTMFVRMLRLPEAVRARYDHSSLQFVVHAAAPCPVAVKRQMIDWWGPIIDEYYAGTEDIGSTYITSTEWLAHPGSVGRPTTPAFIVSEDGRELPTGEAGVVYFAGGRPFEYHNDEAKTAAIADASGRRTLGDIGYLDAAGYLYLTDRQAHMIISGGVNIYPQEAENVLAGHRAVADVAVIGVPDAEMGESVKALVCLVDPAAAGPEMVDELIAHCRSELATYKCPRTVDFVDELPRDPNGKLYKRLLRERYWAGHEGRLA
jgi:fatty-acyl-CoA synthase